jgi:hypothetical protein
MTGFYDITTILKNQLIQDPFVNTVTEGDIFEVDLAKQTIYPLSHIMVNQATREGHAIRFNVTVMCMDIVDKTKDETTDSFRGNDNEQDVLNTQLAVALRAVEVLDRGDLRESATLDGEVVFEPFTERFENYLAGWSATFDVLVRNTMTACDAGSAPVTCPSVTYVIRDDSGNTLYSGSITSGGSLTQIITDATAVLKDTSGATISTTSINAQASANITAPDATYSNSDNSYAGSILSGGSLSIPDSQLTVTGDDTYDVPAVTETIISITDGTDPVTPDSVSLLGNTLTIAVPSGGVAPVGATLMKTGQTTSYRTGDDGDLEAGRATDFFTLSTPNPFGNTRRFTGTTGGYQTGGASFFDKDGVATTNALATPDDIVLDWSTYDNVAGTVLGWRRTDNGVAINWDDSIDGALAVSIGAFTTGWRLPNSNELFSLFCWNSAALVNTASQFSYYPFYATLVNTATFWTSTSLPAATSQAMYSNAAHRLDYTAKTTVAPLRYIPCRTFTVTGTTLT